MTAVRSSPSSTTPTTTEVVGVIDLLTDPFAQSIARRALGEVLILGSICGPIGVWILLYRQSYAAESIAHGMLPGLVLAALIGVPLVIGAGAGVVVAALLIAFAARDERIGSELAVAAVVTGLLGLGGLLALAPATPARLGDLLFGDLLALSAVDLAVTAVLAAAGLAVVFVAHRPLLLVGFDRASAPALGARPRRIDVVLIAVCAATVTAGAQALGSLLVVALLIAPAACALKLSARLAPALLIAAGLAALSGVAGLYLSHYASIAAGAAVALVALAAFALSLFVRDPTGVMRTRRPGPAREFSR